ncbi:MAG: hypothetical protein ACYTHK_13535 [Planctomycetota bacterium]|jgi:protein phosphatase
MLFDEHLPIAALGVFVLSAFAARIAIHRTRTQGLLGLNMLTLGGVVASIYFSVAVLLARAPTPGMKAGVAAVLLFAWVVLVTLGRRRAAAGAPRGATEEEPVGLLDAHGARNERATGHFVVAQLEHSLLVHETSLRLGNDTRLHSGSRGRLLLLADGVGEDDRAIRAGVVASQFATQHLLEHPARGRGARGRLRGAIGAARRALRRMSAAGQSPLEASLLIAQTRWPDIYLAGVGSGIAYRLRGTEFSRIAPRRRAVRRERLRIGDTLLLCTADLQAALGDPEIAGILQASRNARSACDNLLAAARARNAGAGAAAVVARIVSPDDIEAVPAPIAVPPIGGSSPTASEAACRNPGESAGRAVPTRPARTLRPSV